MKRKMTGHVERVWVDKVNPRTEREREVKMWAMIIKDENGEEVDPYARLYENTRATKRRALAELAERLARWNAEEA